MAGWVKAILFLLGGGAAAAGTAYVTGMLDPWLAPKPAEVSTVLKAPDASPQDRQAPAPEEAAEKEAEAAPAAPAAPQEATTTQKQDRLAAPVFDVLRVEPDGSVLVAGKAGADALVEVLSGETVLGKASAGASGDFVVLLDGRLAPGDYRLTLRATAPGGDAALSDGTAIVSIPESETGQVLAMVEEPGQPAQLISVPQAPTDAAPEQVAQAAEEEAAGEEAAQQEAAEEPAAEEQATEEQAGEEEPAAQPQPATPQAAEEQATTGEEEEAAPAAPQPAATHVVSVEAVEIEGDTIFVAGRADAGRTVRVYAGTVHLGDAVASEGGRFLVEARRSLEVGNYLIRADLLGDDGSVVARAGVPFEREPGEAIAAVAPAAPAGDKAVDEKPAEAAEAAAAPEAAAEKAGEDEATAAPLQRADGAVIIRRGDSLWRISRRVYGHGIRYSTIYLANQDQIRNPDRIWPGQVFAVPGQTPEGEQADLDAIGDQAVPPQDGNAAAD